MVGWPLLARCIVVGACLSGCALLAGINDGEDPVVSAGDGGDSDAPAPPPGESGVPLDAGACVPKSVEQPTGAVHAKHAAVPPVLDGKFDEWACVDRIRMGNGAATVGLPPGVMQSVEFAFQWTSTDVYFYAHAITLAPGFDNTDAAVFANDSVHVIIGRDPPKLDDGKYRTGDHQISIDYKQRIGDYVNGTPAATTQAIARVTSKPPVNGALEFEIEARIPVTSLGLPAGTDLSSALKLIVNIMLVDAKAMGGSIGYRVWHLPPIAKCPCVGACCTDNIRTQDTPTCDMRCTESLLLDD